MPPRGSRRSIPAWAGETYHICPKLRLHQVYPRVGGGNSFSIQAYPYAEGLSPRGRGKPHIDALSHAYARSIPAWAGETRGSRRSRCARGVYPRVGGGNLTRAITRTNEQGLSPRGRGKPSSPSRHSYSCGSIPAWAGETALSAPRRCKFRVYPRVGGGNSLSRSLISTTWGLSPRGRGKLLCCNPSHYNARSIPAWAGETLF